MRTIVLLLLAATASAAAPVQLVHQGRLLDAAGDPVHGTADLEVSLFAAASGGDPLWSETLDDVRLDGGYFSAVLGTTGDLPHDVFDEALYVAVAVNGEAMGPRSPLGSIASANSVDGRVRVGDEDDDSVVVQIEIFQRLHHGAHAVIDTTDLSGHPTNGGRVVVVVAVAELPRMR